ncbi:type IV pilus modification protein PilV [Stenotrophomonas sp. Marseille-Q4652]|uniref:type IV pilus modification protein PilV n=1 Tax=Stenotrophomonas sp. Marseille-Q4652 TaxID=2866595 RepID=UPI001CE4A9A4|nr:type IV pilus modification protein PilV [Stenotrophomonas sp. Marseille-Q4652]
MTRPIRRSSGPRRSVAGFSLIEVLIAILVLALGLLGYALLQTMNLRYTQSANYRTVATNLAHDLLDQMRANRLSVELYGSTSSFTAGSVTVPAGGCTRPTTTGPASRVTAAQSIARWKCSVADALGPGAAANVSYADGVANVAITWAERVESGSPTTFAVSTRL